MENVTVSCPYNPTHQVLRSRIQAHIVKCEKKYPPLEICPYNATHRMPKSELAQHVADCHKKVETKKPYPTQSNNNMPTETGQFAKSTDLDYDECWD